MSTIYLIVYIITASLFFRAAYKMHKKHDHDDPFYGSHIVVALCLIGIIPFVNAITGLFFMAIAFLAYLKKRDREG
jgi:uncharacterized membrane protein